MCGDCEVDVRKLFLGLTTKTLGESFIFNRNIKGDQMPEAHLTIIFLKKQISLQ